MKIVIPGGSGQVGSLLARSLSQRGHEVVVLSRAAKEGEWRHAAWDGETIGPWADEIDGADAVINLAGRSVNCRYTAEHRREILDSRVKSTRVVGQAISGCSQPPRVWLQAATATIYPHRLDAPNDEASQTVGQEVPGAPDTWHFSMGVAKAWEAALEESETPHTRKIALRSAMVMTPDRGGVFDVLLGLVRRGLGGRTGDGSQYVAWIHGEDFVRAAEFLMQRDDLSGPFNFCAPNPIPNRDFMRAMRDAWGISLGLPAAKWMVEIGTRFMRTESELVLKSRRVIPGRLLESGFEFSFRNWPAAAVDLTARWRAERSR